MFVVFGFYAGEGMTRTAQRSRCRWRAEGVFGTTWFLTVAVFLGGCSGPPEMVVEVAPAATTSPVVDDAFSARRAFVHLREIAALGSRVAGSASLDQTRSYLRQQLEALEIEVLEHSVMREDGSLPTRGIVNISARIPGTSHEDIFVLAAPMDRSPGAGQHRAGTLTGASGPALLLEAARVFRREPLPFDLVLVFLDGEHWQPGRYFGSELLLQQMQTEPRLLLYVDRVAEAELEVRRDLWSHRVLRDRLFRVAQALTYDQAFPMDAPFEQISAGHRVWFESGWRQVIALVATHDRGKKSPLVTEGDVAAQWLSESSLQMAGDVVVAGLRELAAYFQRIDAYRKPNAQPERVLGASEKK